ncbi:hypothetical protein [Hydrogenimonas sp.]
MRQFGYLLAAMLVTGLDVSAFSTFHSQGDAKGGFAGSGESQVKQESGRIPVATYEAGPFIEEPLVEMPQTPEAHKEKPKKATLLESFRTMRFSERPPQSASYEGPVTIEAKRVIEAKGLHNPENMLVYDTFEQPLDLDLIDLRPRFLVADEIHDLKNGFKFHNPGFRTVEIYTIRLDEANYLFGGLSGTYLYNSSAKKVTELEGRLVSAFYVQEESSKILPGIVTVTTGYSRDAKLTLYRPTVHGKRIVYKKSDQVPIEKQEAKAGILPLYSEKEGFFYYETAADAEKKSHTELQHRTVDMTRNLIIPFSIDMGSDLRWFRASDFQKRVGAFNKKWGDTSTTTPTDVKKLPAVTWLIFDRFDKKFQTRLKKEEKLSAKQLFLVKRAKTRYCAKGLAPFILCTGDNFQKIPLKKGMILAGLSPNKERTKGAALFQAYMGGHYYLIVVGTSKTAIFRMKKAVQLVMTEPLDGSEVRSIGNEEYEYPHERFARVLRESFRAADPKLVEVLDTAKFLSRWPSARYAKSHIGALFMDGRSLYRLTLTRSGVKHEAW